MSTIEEIKKETPAEVKPVSQLPLQGAGRCEVEVLSGSQAVLEALICEGVETYFSQT
jgi:hypothetical protein